MATYEDIWYTGGPTRRLGLLGADRNEGDCRLIGCARWCDTPGETRAEVCIRPAGHAGECRPHLWRDLEAAETLVLCDLSPDLVPRWGRVG